ncbi:MAG: YifB family Mg chelatase-like AAA ATPase [Rhodocyclaceae bacterium]
MLQFGGDGQGEKRVTLAVLRSRALAGMEAPEVMVEVHLANGLPSFTLVGLPDTEVREARDRVRAAIQNARFEFPARRVTVNLAPADLPKEGGRFDLPIALGILMASGQLPAADGECEFAGELSLSGSLRPVRGMLPMCLNAQRAGHALVVPCENAAEAAIVRDAVVLPAGSLLEVCAHLAGKARLAPYRGEAQPAPQIHPDLAEVKGQAHAKRALEVAAAGGHGLLMVGPPGTGKSMLAARFPGLLPAMTEEEALESAAIGSALGRFRFEDWRQRPFRAPHHSASAAAMVGGGTVPRPGEISAAHNGVLFLDELPEFDRRVLEALREPLETGRITVSRAARQADFPARFQLVAAMNPCPCGFLGHRNGRCRCTPEQVARYRARLSGPLLDRIDICVEVPAVAEEDLERRSGEEPSAAVRERVEAARARQIARQGHSNAALTPAEVDEHCTPDAAGARLLRQALSRLGLSARGYHRVLRLARSIADLAGAPQVASAHVAEAVQYRRGLAAG